MRGGLLIINPMIVRKEVLDKILQLGEPTVLLALADTICPVHTKDVRAWRQKFQKSIFCCPHTAYYRLVRDIPLVHLRDLTIEIQMHYDDVEVIFPTDDRKELQLLLQVKDQYANTDEPNEALVTGEMFVGPATDKDEIKESTCNKLSSLISRGHDYTAWRYHQVRKEHVVVGLLPSHGNPVVDSELNSASQSSSSSELIEAAARRRTSKTHAIFTRLANSFGADKKPRSKKED